MNKEAFLLALYDALDGVPVEDKERSIAYYREMIDERVEDGMSEEEAVAALGSVEDIAAEIMGETPDTRGVPEQPPARRALRAWEIALLVLGSPVWVPLALAALAVLLAVYMVIWAVVVSLFAALASLAAGGVVLLAHAVVNSVTLGAWGVLMALGAGAALFGTALLLWSPVTALTKRLAQWTGRLWGWVKQRLVRRGGEER